MKHRLCIVLLLLALALPLYTVNGQIVPVRHKEGLVHGFLALRSLDGETLADGDLTQVARGDLVTSHLLFHFRDGSIHDETTVFSQRQSFRLISDHLIQRGPAFPHPIEITIHASTGEVRVRYPDRDGNEKVVSAGFAPAAELANGMVLTLLKNLKPADPEITLSMAVATPKPRMVKLIVTSNGEQGFTTGKTKRKATEFVVKVKIGGLTGLVAPIIGKEPPDTHVWILNDPAPTFVRSEGPLFEGGPVWRIELISPTWPQ
jgi:hypothetical protein